MRRRALAVALVAALAGCGAEPATSADDEEPTSPSSEPAPTVGPVGTDAFAVRDALVEQVRASGGVRMAVTGRPSATTVELVHDADQQDFARRFAWETEGEAMELIELAGGRVCVNLAAGVALRNAGNAGMGYVEPSDRPYSCTPPGDGNLAAFVVYGYSALDPVGRLSRLMGDVRLTDVGPETGEDGLATRHVQITATESDRSLRQTPTTFDLWVDADLRLVRAEFTSLDEELGPYVATFDYDEIATVLLPAEAERGDLVLRTGTGPGTVHPPA